MSQPKTVLVFGGSGTVGQGAIRALLEKAYRVVAVFRDAKSADNAKSRLGNPSESTFAPVIGTLDSEETASALLDNVKKAGDITDVVSSLGGWWQKGPILQQSLEEYTTVQKNNLQPHFMAAKTFLPLIADKEGSSYTFITGGAANYYIQGAGFITVFIGALVKMIMVIQAEHKTKPVRINEFRICFPVQPWDAVTESAVSNLAVGQAIAGVVTFPAARGASIEVTPTTLDKLAATGCV